MAKTPIANARLNVDYLAKTFFDLDKRITSTETDGGTAADNINQLSADVQKALTQLVRAAVVQTAISPSAGFPAIGTGTIKLVDYFNPALLEPDEIPAYSYDTTGFTAGTVLFVANLNNSYFVIKDV